MNLEVSSNYFLRLVSCCFVTSSGEPRFDVNVTVPAYVMDDKKAVVRGVVMANHTSGRPCKGNMSITAFLLPPESVWLSRKGWEKPYHVARNKGGNSNSGVPLQLPEYRPIKSIPTSDYHLYFDYEYRFIDYYDGRVDFTWSRDDLLTIAHRAGLEDSLVNCEVVFFANVTDWYSDMNRTGWAGTILFDNTVRLDWVGGAVRTFKPGQLLKVQVAVSQYDGKPVVDGGAVTVVPTIVVSGAENTPAGTPLTSPVIGGIAHFEVQLSPNTQRFDMTATYKDPREAMQEGRYANILFVKSEATDIQMIGSKYYSPSNTYITVSSSTDHPRVNEYMVFHVTTSHFVRRIYYQILSQSNVVLGDELEMTSRQKTFAVGMSRAMVPAARIVVYFLWQPEEVVSDVLSFFVNGTSQNMLIDELMTYDSSEYKGYKHLQRVSDTDYEYKFFHGYDYGIDGKTTFETAGLLILTDADVTRLPNLDSCDPQLGQFPCFSGVESECFTLEQKCNGKLDGCPSDGADEMGCVYEDKQHAVHQSGIDRVSRVMRFYDNSSWAWQEIFVKPNGRVDFRVDVPKYPLSWVINGISVSRDLGLGIMRQPVRLDAARNMYIQVEHPKYIVWGEQIGVRVTVFNYWYDDDYLEVSVFNIWYDDDSLEVSVFNYWYDDDFLEVSVFNYWYDDDSLEVSVFNYWYDDDYLEVLVTMHADRNTEFVVVEDMGWVTSYSPKTHNGDHQTILFIEPGESKDIYMPIVAKREYHGEKLQFHVSATCFMEKDEYVGEMFLQPPGVLNYYHTPYLIDLIRFPSLVSPSLKVEVQEQYREAEVRENVYVPESPTAMVTLFGDVVTPGFFENLLNADNVLYRPYGSGESAAFNLAYNIHVLLFQWESNQVDLDEETRVLKDLNTVFQRLLSYMDPSDGSFRMFRDDEKSSLWLTAFVAKTLALARSRGSWEMYLYIPSQVLGRAVTYVCSRQNVTSGAFEPDEGDLAFDRKMASLGDMKNNIMLTHPIPLTAYVITALHHISGFENAIEPAKRNAARYLAGQAPDMDSSEMFFLAISAYALTLTQTNSDLPERLWKLKRNDSDYLYFADQRVYGNPSKILNTESYFDARQELMNDAYAVQTTAYALMTHIRSNQPSKTERDMTMSWMNTMRNSFAGFSSTQDTIVALEALSLYAGQDPNRNEFGLDLTLSVSTESSWERNIHIPKNDFTRVHRSYLPEHRVYGYIRSDSEGVGRAMLQLTTTKRVEFEQYVKKPMRYDNDPEKDPIPFYDIELTLNFRGRNNSIMHMTPCVSWLYTDRSLTSGLSVLEVDLPTGYVVMNDTLRDYVRSGVVPNLRRAEVYRRTVYYYFQALDQSKTCVDLRADRWYPVANTTSDNRIRVYDYYEPGMHYTRIYTVKGLYLMHICLACGSYQCPYCPGFNTASLAQTGHVSWFLVLLVYLAWQQWMTKPGT
ncbi:macroglobulin complement-related 2 [Elysia marginata]|uniref:Macroglobulin complement-related 2 n=1 Tax=Elysia marginata TaxID=1093978 RepID=A0AAV4I0H3_9GAST|nr:macroglobulin complement-related 2 [Elysia marginata]